MCIVHDPQTYITFCKDQNWEAAQDEWTQAQKTQNNEFVESGLENQVRMSWTANKIGSIHKGKENGLD